MQNSHTRALLSALLVTFIWSCSWVLIKIGLKNMPPLTFAGLRYTLAFLVLLVLMLRSPALRAQWQALTWRDLRPLLLLGLVYYSLAQGAQFAALAYLPSVTLSLLLNITPIVVALLGILLLHEHVLGWQWFGIAVFLAGTLLYFYPINFPTEQVIGLVIAAVCVLSNALGGIMGRSANRSLTLSPQLITTVSMGVGGVLLLIFGLLTEGFPQLDVQAWLIIIWLAVVHTAFTFTLWNHTLRVLTAVESSVVGNTMMVQIAVLALVFLGETITGQELAGLVVASLGILIVQTARYFVRRPQATAP